jgi:hypothetical protein
MPERNRWLPDENGPNTDVKSPDEAPNGGGTRRSAGVSNPWLEAAGVGSPSEAHHASLERRDAREPEDASASKRRKIVQLQAQIEELEAELGQDSQ